MRRFHSDRRDFKCDKCEQKFVFRSELNYHIRNAHDQSAKNLKCGLCSFTTNKKDSLEKHVLIHFERPEYKCKYCSFISCSKSSLRSHMFTQHTNKVYRCNFQGCNNAYMEENDLFDHIKASHHTKIYACPQCPMSFDVEKYLDHHLAIKHDDQSIPRFKCKHCSKLYLSVSGFEAHMLKHTNGEAKKYICDICGKEFILPNSFRQHMNTHNKRYQCNYCDKLFGKRCGAVLHERTCLNNPGRTVLTDKGSKNLVSRQHSDTNGERDDAEEELEFDDYKCEYCDYKTDHKTRLSVHIYRRHTNKEHRCRYNRTCKMLFTSEADMFEHIKSAHPQKKYPCHLCPMSFITQSLLNAHLFNKHDDKTVVRYTCKVCGKMFGGLLNLKSHQVMHEKERKHSCEVCGKRFARAAGLRFHSRIHTGEKPFSCRYCGKMISFLSSCQSHEATCKQRTSSA